MNRTIAAAMLVPFVLFTAYVMVGQGFSPLLTVLADGGWGSQVFLDLCVSILLLNTFIHRDASQRGISPWPWIAASLLVGSIAPLTYFVVRKND